MDATVRFQPSGRAIAVASGTSLLDAARRAGLPVASACGANGMCGRCGMQVLEGRESLSRETAHETRVKRRNRVDPSLRLSCFTSVRGDATATAAYW